MASSSPGRSGRIETSPNGQPAPTASRRASGIGRCTVDGPDVRPDHLARPVDAELGEQERDLAALGREDLVLGREVPQLALERPDRLLAGRVDELLVGLAVLALVGRVRVAPGLDLAVERLGEGRVLVERVLEPGREVDLGGLDRREAVEQLVGQRRRAVLDGARQPVVTTGHLAELAEDLEVELDLGDATVRERHAAVAGAGLDADLADARSRRAPAPPARVDSRRGTPAAPRRSSSACRPRRSRRRR